MKLLLTLTGPSCAGKTTLEGELSKNGFNRAISTTTRAMRVNEKNGVDYHFVTTEEFHEKSRNNGLIESIHFADNWYGVSKEEIDRLFALGDAIVIVCEPVGAKQIRKFCKTLGDVTLRQVFIDNPQVVISERILRRFGDDYANAKNKQDGSENRILESYVKRLSVMNGIERTWVDEAYGYANPMRSADVEVKEDFQYDTVITEFNDANINDVVSSLIPVKPKSKMSP